MLSVFVGDAVLSVATTTKPTELIGIKIMCDLEDGSPRTGAGQLKVLVPGSSWNHHSSCIFRAKRSLSSLSSDGV